MKITIIILHEVTKSINYKITQNITMNLLQLHFYPKKIGCPSFVKPPGPLKRQSSKIVLIQSDSFPSSSFMYRATVSLKFASNTCRIHNTSVSSVYSSVYLQLIPHTLSRSGSYASPQNGVVIGNIPKKNIALLVSLYLYGVTTFGT